MPTPWRSNSGIRVFFPDRSRRPARILVEVPPSPVTFCPPDRGTDLAVQESTLQYGVAFRRFFRRFS
jgi:hypothetical protein